MNRGPAQFDFDVAIAGAGAVGLACGYAFSRRGLGVAVLEANAAVGHGISSRNSEVIHAGLYYPTGSLKARLCIEGRRALYAFLDAHDVQCSRCGKLVVGTADARDRVQSVFQQARKNGVEEVHLLSNAELHQLEPELTAEVAILSPESGIFDSHGYMLALQGEIERAGGVVSCRTPFAGAAPLATSGFCIRTGGADPATICARYLVNAAGLSAQELAERIEGFPNQLIPPLHYAKGCYFRLQGRAPFRHLVYPPPVEGSLGIHYRRDLAGHAVFGPDLTYVDQIDYTVDETAAPRFYEAIRRYWPSLPDDALLPDYAGIRPKIHGPGEPQPDFRIDGPAVHGIEGLVALFGIESPGLTSSLAIGEETVSLLCPSVRRTQ